MDEKITQLQTFIEKHAANRAEKEALLHTLTQLDEAQQYKESLINLWLAMAVEFRHALTSTNGYTTFVLRELVGTLNDQQKELLTRVSSFLYYMRRVLAEVIIDLAEIMRFGVKVRLKEVDLAVAAREVIEETMSLTQWHDNFLSLQPGEGLGTLQTDKKHLKAMLAHLISAGNVACRDGHLSLIVRREVDHVLFDLVVRGLEPERIIHFTESRNWRMDWHDVADIWIGVSYHFCEALGGSLTIGADAEQKVHFIVKLPTHE